MQEMEKKKELDNALKYKIASKKELSQMLNGNTPVNCELPKK